MANLSSGLIEISGDRLEEALKVIDSLKESCGDYIVPEVPKGNTPGSYGYSCFRISSEKRKGKKYILTGMGNWCSPHRFLKDLAKEFCLDIDYLDEESGANFFHLIKIEKGEVISDEEYEYFSNESVKHNGINYYVEDMCWIPETENWEEVFSDELEIFHKNGKSLEYLKEAWCA